VTVCEQCGNAIGLRFLDTRLAWVHLAPGSEGAYWVLDHDAQPAPELPLEGQEGAQEP